MCSSVPYQWVDGEQTGRASRADLAWFRAGFYDCLTARADALFELTDAVLCAEGPVTSLVGLSLAAEHRRGHGALYDAVANGRVEVARLGRCVASLPVPRDRDGRIVLAVDVSAWLRPDAPCSAERLFCHVYARGKGQAQMIPGWPYSFVAALEPGRSSWTALLDAVRLGPDDDLTAVTAGQVREVVARLREAGHWRPGDPDILIVFDAGYDVSRLAFLLGDLPVQLVGRLRSDRVFCFPPAPPEAGRTGRPAKHHRKRWLSSGRWGCSGLIKFGVRVGCCGVELVIGHRCWHAEVASRLVWSAGALPSRGWLGAPPRVPASLRRSSSGLVPGRRGCGGPDNAQSSLCRVRRGGPWCLTSLEAQRPGGLAPLCGKGGLFGCRRRRSEPGRH